jgi:hypothetical protein
MVNLNGHEAGNGGHSQGKPTAYRNSSSRREAIFHHLTIGLPGGNQAHNSKYYHRYLA